METESAVDLKDRIREAEAVEIARAWLDSGNVPLTVEFEMLGATFTFASLTAKENEDALRENDGMDILTREPHLQRAILSRAFVELNGRPISREAASKFLHAIPPGGVANLFRRYGEMRTQQELRFGARPFEALGDAAKK